MEFLPFSCRKDDLATLQLISMLKILHNKFTNRVLEGGAPCRVCTLFQKQISRTIPGLFQDSD